MVITNIIIIIITIIILIIVIIDHSPKVAFQGLFGRHDINKLKFNRSTRFPNLSSKEWPGLKSLKKRKDIVIKAADKGGAVVVWRTDLYQKEALR